ncbi:hypothetical protein Pyn_16090 [Prunus yedoensis var. nudiflora]|uniref:Uncharacterized protein n=1 Tax=Prunus yedoensis var. nudiflora TaxID=2094558 RepID=A0A314YWX6_PRUYE|nr:hypothetical protein Pyn_16090 [Prunus yedoensis var. nudiflora]
MSIEDPVVRAGSPVPQLDSSFLSTWLLRIPLCGKAKRSLVGLFPFPDTWILGYLDMSEPRALLAGCFVDP